MDPALLRGFISGSGVRKDCVHISGLEVEGVTLGP